MITDHAEYVQALGVELDRMEGSLARARRLLGDSAPAKPVEVAEELPDQGDSQGRQALRAVDPQRSYANAVEMTLAALRDAARKNAQG